MSKLSLLLFTFYRLTNHVCVAECWVQFPNDTAQRWPIMAILVQPGWDFSIVFCLLFNNSLQEEN